MAHILQNGNRSSRRAERAIQPLPNSIFKNVVPGSGACARATSPFPGSWGDRTHLLSGWKEIANYMHRGVRTVQRWELMGLPVRRVTTTNRSPVIACAEDLDVWARSLHVPLLDSIEELRATISSLEAEIRSLKCQLRARNLPWHNDTIPGSYSPTQQQQSQNCPSGSLPQSRSKNSSPMKQ